MRTNKDRWLLALLALQMDKPLDRDWLAQTLWPDIFDNRALLRKSLYELRKASGYSDGGYRKSNVDNHSGDAANAGTS